MVLCNLSFIIVIFVYSLFYIVELCLPEMYNLLFERMFVFTALHLMSGMLSSESCCKRRVYVLLNHACIYTLSFTIVVTVYCTYYVR